MKIDLDTTDENANKIKSYSEEAFRVNDSHITSNIIIARERLIDNWLQQGYSAFAAQHLDEVIAWKPEIIILGTGENIAFPDPAITAYVNSFHIGLEIMDTGAACRSYNVLIDEGRDVVACLFLSAS